MVEIGHEKREGGFQVSGGRGDNGENGIEEGSHSPGFDFWGDFSFPLHGGVALFGGGVDGWKIELGVRGVQFDKEIEDLIENFFRIGIFTIDFIKDNNRFGTDFQGFSEDELGLGLRAFGGVHHQENTIDHAKNALYFSTEVGMAWGINDIHADVFVLERGVFGLDGNAPLPLEIHRVHHPLGHDLVRTESTRLAEELIDEGCLPVIHVSDNRNISEFGVHHKNSKIAGRSARARIV